MEAKENQLFQHVGEQFCLDLAVNLWSARRAADRVLLVPWSFVARQTKCWKELGGV